MDSAAKGSSGKSSRRRAAQGAGTTADGAVPKMDNVSGRWWEALEGAPR
jgi:hypothetical protein